jgi:hypothetical protein
MSALAKRAVRVAVVPEVKEPEVLIHLRFNAAGDVTTIGEKPEHLSVFEWYKLLREGASNHYQTFAGGRGFFRIPQSTFDAIRAKA